MVPPLGECLVSMCDSANVGFRALKLPSHSGIIHAHCRSSPDLPTASPNPRFLLLLICSTLRDHNRLLSPLPFPDSSPLFSFFSLFGTSLITSTVSTTTTSYRKRHLLVENNIHKSWSASTLLRGPFRHSLRSTSRSHANDWQEIMVG